MGTDIRPEISKNSKYWISKHRYLELKHFCLQYGEWKRRYEYLSKYDSGSGGVIRVYSARTVHTDPTQQLAVEKAYFANNIDLVEKAAYNSDELLGGYILKAVTEGRSYNYLKTVLEIPCDKNTYYERYRRFFWLLSNKR